MAWGESRGTGGKAEVAKLWQRQYALAGGHHRDLQVHGLGHGQRGLQAPCRWLAGVGRGGTRGHSAPAVGWSGGSGGTEAVGPHAGGWHGGSGPM